ncbi:uncharacterized protein AMSG_00110 [Thecamonas trahens ATCC 50062]|uniref:Uncharacterized protein n=1 Tax=Thecamonas trahens ATCC 50062 TaxID=461836 RepID=A0A0L0D167_THETB|nr:hypothetical protein AMSG_00110 [Thecamonas trahens ATCC 50062]KNC45992.1 hypothetical protein AMSG_00110 [Thecamonas trahens ATCC 50062]|eukprot:XP_013762972.1 hypothetical protein AMSG_00110 [Thecamonas trahens ATCC 50062]
MSKVYPDSPDVTPYSAQDEAEVLDLLSRAKQVAPSPSRTPVLTSPSPLSSLPGSPSTELERAAARRRILELELQVKEQAEALELQAAALQKQNAFLSQIEADRRRTTAVRGSRGSRSPGAKAAAKSDAVKSEVIEEQARLIEELRAQLESAAEEAELNTSLAHEESLLLEAKYEATTRQQQAVIEELEATAETQAALIASLEATVEILHEELDRKTKEVDELRSSSALTDGPSVPALAPAPAAAAPPASAPIMTKAPTPSSPSLGPGAFVAQRAIYRAHASPSHPSHASPSPRRMAPTSPHGVHPAVFASPYSSPLVRQIGSPIFAQRRSTVATRPGAGRPIPRVEFQARMHKASAQIFGLTQMQHQRRAYPSMVPMPVAMGMSPSRAARPRYPSPYARSPHQSGMIGKS